MASTTTLASSGFKAGARAVRTRHACDLIIVVDASGPLLRQDRRFGWGGSVWRSKDVQYQQSRAARIRWWIDSLLAGKLRGLHVPMTETPQPFNRLPAFTRSRAPLAAPCPWALPIC